MNICVYIKYMHEMGYNAVKTMIKQCKVSKSYVPYKIPGNPKSIHRKVYFLICVYWNDMTERIMYFNNAQNDL